MYFVDSDWYKRMKLWGIRSNILIFVGKMSLSNPRLNAVTYKGTRECVCNVCMTVWKASADTSVLCTLT